MTERATAAAPSPYATGADVAGHNRRLAAGLVGGAAAVPAAALLVVLALVWSVLPAVGLAVAGWVLLAAYLGARGADAVLDRLGGAPADPVAHARLFNLVDSLCVAAGLSRPALVVVPTPTPGALAVGQGPREATLVVTAGLLEKLSRVELEGVLAHELAHVRRGDVAVSAALGATLDPLARLVPSLAAPLARAVTGRREALADMAAIGLTRYPPGLIGGLEKLRSERVSRTSPTVDLLWTVPPPVGDRMDGALADPVDARIQALLEL